MTNRAAHPFEDVPEAVVDDAPLREAPEASRLPLGKWTAACAAGELVGFCGAGLAFAIAFAVVPHREVTSLALVFFVACVAAGVIEGSVLGAFQWWALRRVYPSLRASTWIAVTALAGATGWLAASIGAALVALAATMQAPVSLVPAPPALLHAAVVSAALGSVIGTVFGVLQWLALRRHAANAGAWIVANILGWMLAMPWSYVAARVSSVTGSPVVLLIAVLGAGALMGVTIGLVTWALTRRLVSHGARELEARPSAPFFEPAVGMPEPSSA